MNYVSLNAIAVANIRAIMGARRESIRDLSAAVRMPESTIKRRLLNQAPFTLEELERIAIHFSLSGATLISPSLVASPAPALADPDPAHEGSR